MVRRRRSRPQLKRRSLGRGRISHRVKPRLLLVILTMNMACTRLREESQSAQADTLMLACYTLTMSRWQPPMTDADSLFYVLPATMHLQTDTGPNPWYPSDSRIVTPPMYREPYRAPRPFWQPPAAPPVWYPPGASPMTLRPDTLPRPHSRAFWRTMTSDTIQVTWLDGFTSIVTLFTQAGDTLRGPAAAYSDASHTAIASATVVAVKRACP